jgi:hypothetical protein
MINEELVFVLAETKNSALFFFPSLKIIVSKLVYKYIVNTVLSHEQLAARCEPSWD